MRQIVLIIILAVAFFSVFEAANLWIYDMDSLAC